MQVSVVEASVHAAQLAIPVIVPLAPAAQVIQTVPLRTEPNGHSVQVAGVVVEHLLQREAAVHETEQAVPEIEYPGTQTVHVLASEPV